jgi:hypothetical protein
LASFIRVTNVGQVRTVGGFSSSNESKTKLESGLNFGTGIGTGFFFFFFLKNKNQTRIGFPSFLRTGTRTFDQKQSFLRKKRGV